MSARSSPASESVTQRQQLRSDIEKAVFDYAGTPAKTPTEPGVFLQLIDATQVAIEECNLLQRAAVHQARRADNSWAAIGDLLGITRQAAQQRFAIESPDTEAAPGLKLVKGASAFNEMRLLENEGREGYHLVDFGVLYLAMQASNKQWDHRREMALNITGKRSRLEKAGWTYVGAWFPFHYFKRVR